MTFPTDVTTRDHNPLLATVPGTAQQLGGALSGCSRKDTPFGPRTVRVSFRESPSPPGRDGRDDVRERSCAKWALVLPATQA